MQIATASLVGLDPVPLEQLVKQLQGSHVTAIEVNIGPCQPTVPGVPGGGQLDIGAVLQHGTGHIEEQLGDSGIRISALAPMLNLLDADPAVRSERIRYFEDAIDAAHMLGVKTVVTYGGSPHGMWFQGLPSVGPHHQSNFLDHSVRAFRDVFTPLAQRAADRGVQIALETAPRGGGHGNVAHSPELWDRIFDAVPNPAIGLSFDPSHLVWLQIPNIPGLVRAYADRIHHFDGKDAEILPDQLARQGILGTSWWRYRLPGLGALDWTALFSSLREIGYDHAVAIEQEDPVVTGLEGVLWSAGYLHDRLLPGFSPASDGADR